MSQSTNDIIKLAVSIPVHEALDCVLDQAKNWQAFAPEALVVFHVSAQAPFSTLELTSELDKLSVNAIVNPTQLDTGWADGSLIKVHINNFVFLTSRYKNMMYFAMDASNTLLVRHGLVDHMIQYFNEFHPTAGYNTPKPSIECASAHAMHEDVELQDSLMSCSRFMPEVGIVPCEGVWFDAIRFNHVVRIIREHNWNGKYATEEVYPVAAWNFVAPSYSRVAGNYIMAPFEANLHVTRDDVEAIHHGYHKNLNLFGVKRVPREINHPIRVMIRTIGGYD